MVAPRIRSGHDGGEVVITIRIGQGAPATGKVRIERRRMLVRVVEVAPGRVALPDLHQGVSYRKSIVVDHPARYRNTLSDRLTSMLSSEIVVGLADLIVPEERSCNLRQRVGKHDERFARCPKKR